MSGNPAYEEWLAANGLPSAVPVEQEESPTCLALVDGERCGKPSEDRSRCIQHRNWLIRRPSPPPASKAEAEPEPEADRAWTASITPEMVAQAKRPGRDIRPSQFGPP